MPEVAEIHLVVDRSAGVESTEERGSQDREDEEDQEEQAGHPHHARADGDQGLEEHAQALRGRGRQDGGARSR